MRPQSLIFAAGATLTLCPAAFAQSFAISWHSIGSGGGRSASPTLSITGTIAQLESGPALASPGLFIQGGFWPSVSGTLPGCVADIDDGTFSGTPDGGVTIDDLLYYLLLYEQGDIRADIDDGSFSGTRDGGVTIDDLLFFLFHYESGC